MMKVIGEEGTAIEDFVIYLKSEFLDYVYLQQNTFDEVDAANGADRQRNTFALVQSVLKREFNFTDKDDARRYFLELRQLCMDLNYLREDSAEYQKQYAAIQLKINESGEKKNA